MLEVRTVPRLADVTPSAWDALTGEDDPFVEHAFLHTLEASGSVGPGTSWIPVHQTVWRSGTLVGALPLYVKLDSWGEFVFDFQWARAAQGAGIPYYPKLTSMAPFTPATGRRLLVREGEDRAAVIRALVAGARAQADALEASSIHVLFTTDEERDRLVDCGLAPRLSLQFHWRNAGYTSFAHYLETMRSPARKQILRERREVRESGLEVVVREGHALDDREWDALAEFYARNCARHGSAQYLTPAFFALARETLAHRLVAVLALRDGVPIAGSINFERGAHLYGRYWGAREDSDFLHFEVCYYRLIERAIERRLSRFEAGAQGAHKLKRGLLATRIHSNHWIRDERLREAVLDYLPREAWSVERDLEELNAAGPFKRG